MTVPSGPSTSAAYAEAARTAGLAVARWTVVAAPLTPDPVERETAPALVDSEEPRRREDLAARLRGWSARHGGPFLPQQLSLIVPSLLARTLRQELQDLLRA